MEEIFQGLFNFFDKFQKKQPLDIENLKHNDIKRGVIGWIISQNPSGIGLDVPTRFSRYIADIAAFWSEPVKRNGKKNLYPVKTIVIETKFTREDCWPDCAKKETLLPLLKEKKECRETIEKCIRETEPELNLNDTLFPEIESWNYHLSSNKNYHKCLKDIENLENALYHGSHFEKIRKALIADYLYLAVPKGMVSEHEIADGWGLLYVDKKLNVSVIKTAYNWKCPIDNKIHFVQNISKSNLKNITFALGINVDKKGKIKFGKKPKRRYSTLN